MSVKSHHPVKALTISDSAQIQIAECFTELWEAEVPFLLTTVNCAVRSTMKVYCNYVILFLIVNNSCRSPGLFEKKKKQNRL